MCYDYTSHSPMLTVTLFAFTKILSQKGYRKFKVGVIINGIASHLNQANLMLKELLLFAAYL